jgi:hypothetical protein
MGFPPGENGFLGLGRGAWGPKRSIAVSFLGWGSGLHWEKWFFLEGKTFLNGKCLRERERLEEKMSYPPVKCFFFGGGVRLVGLVSLRREESFSWGDYTVPLRNLERRKILSLQSSVLGEYTYE